MLVQTSNSDGHHIANLYYANIFVSLLTLALKCSKIYYLISNFYRNNNISKILYPTNSCSWYKIHTKYMLVFRKLMPRTIYIWKTFLKILNLYVQHSTLCRVCTWVIIDKCLNSFSIAFCCFLWLLMLSMDVCWYLPEMWIIKILLPWYLVQQWNSEYKTYSMKYVS